MRVAIILLLLVTGCASGCTRDVRDAIIDGTSMEPLLHDGEQTCIDLSAYDDATPVRGDLVMYDFPGGALVKRVAAVPDDTWSIEEGKILINGVLATNSQGRTYTVTENQAAMLANYVSYDPLPAEHYILLSEDPAASEDSRSYGLANIDDIKGRVVACG